MQKFISATGPRALIAGLLGGITLLSAGASSIAFAQSAAAYPNKPVRFVVPYPPGGSLDSIARALAENVKSSLGTVIVENRPGAGGNVGADYVAKSPADGYTIVMGAVATHAINPALYPKMPYDPVKDFQPITLVASTPNVLIVNTGGTIKSVKDLIDTARKGPGKLNFGSGSNGSAGHLAGELFKQQTSTFIVHIPYAGGNPALLALMSNQTDFMFDNLANAMPQIRAGKVTPLAVTTANRASTMPELPTMAESDPRLKGFDINTWFGIFAPAGTPRDVVARLHRDFSAALKSADMKERLARFGAEPGGGTPEEFSAFIAREIPKYARIVKVSGAKVD
jgi:tripartite-type tricarboxylate transporter receptor subunit TctC